MSPLLSTILSIVFLASGAVAVYTMSSVMGGKKTENIGKHKLVHAISGWLFAALFALIFIFMVVRVENYWEESSPRIAIHVALSVALVVLLALKVSIKRIFPNLGKNYFLLGITVYTLSFTTVGISAGYYIIWKYEPTPELTQEELQTHMLEINLGKELFIKECSACHLLKDIMTPRSAESWGKVVTDMIEIAEPRITPAEGEQILNYLSKTHLPEHFETGKDATILEKHCLPCHDATEIYDQRHNREGWTDIVKQMRQYDKELIPGDKIEEIVDYLLSNQ